MRQSATLYYDIINRRITVKDGSISDTKNKIFPCDASFSRKFYQGMA